MTTQQVNDIINRGDGRIDIMKRWNGSSIAYEKNIPLPYDITNDIETIFDQKQADYVRINLYTKEGVRPVKTFDIEGIEKPNQSSFSGVEINRSQDWFYQNEITRLNSELLERKTKCNILRDKLDDIKEDNSKIVESLKEQVSRLKEEVRFAEREAKLQLQEIETKKENTLGGFANKLANSDRFIELVEKVAFKVLTPVSNEVSDHQAEVKSIEPAPSNYSPTQIQLADSIEPFILSLDDTGSHKLYQIMQYLSADRANLDTLHTLIQN